MKVALLIISIGLLILLIRQTMLIQKLRDSKKRLKDTLDKLNKESENKDCLLQQKSEEISELENTVANLRKTSNKTKQHEETISTLNLKNSQLTELLDKKEKEIQRLSSDISNLSDELKDSNSKLTNLYNKIDSENHNTFNIQIKEITAEKDKLSSEVVQLRKQIQNASVADKKQIEDFSHRILELTGVNENLAKQIKELNSIISEKDNTINDLKNKYNELFQGAEKLRDSYNQLKTLSVQKNTVHSKTDSNPGRTEKTFESGFMFINETDSILFGDSGIDDAVLKIKKYSDIVNFLSDNKETELYEMYSSYLNDYISELDDALENIECDDDELSQEYTIKYCKVLSKYFIERILEKAFEDYKRDNFSADFAELLKKYLSSVYVYTKKVSEGDIVDTATYSVELSEKTEDETLHRKIKDIILPAFYIKYISSMGKIKEKLVCKGKVSVYSTKS